MKWPPGKETGALQAPIPKLYLLETTAAHTPLQGCEHRATVTERLPDGYRHYAREVCATCDRHVRWLPKPETIAREQLNSFRLARLAMCDRLNPWEREFIRDVSKRRKLSPKQHAIIARLCTQYLEVTP